MSIWSRRWRIWVLGLTVILLLTGAANYERYLATSDRPVDAYPILSLEEHRRLLVVAPHCDDETLASAGLIRAALRRGMDVRVVIATAGDGYIRATATWFGRPPRAADFVALGELRQRESLNALSRLGLDTGDVIFLTYPERRLPVLWWDRWKTPDRSPFTRRTHNLYSRAFRFNAPYTGEGLLEDLRALLQTFRPDLIVLPHPDDAHFDHRTLSIFVRLAVAMEEASDPEYNPLLLGYLVHYGQFPQPTGLRPTAFLLPPRQLETIGEWLQWPLSADDVTVKRAAVEAYPSQIRVLGRLLHSFIRQNELFIPVDSAISLEGVDGALVYDPQEIWRIGGDGGFASVADPVKDSVIRWVAGGADIAHLALLRTGDSLWVGVEMRGRPAVTYDYRLYVRAISSDGESPTWMGRWGQKRRGDVSRHGRFLWYRVDLEALGNPAWVALTAETREEGVLDFTAWYLLRLE